MADLIGKAKDYMLSRRSFLRMTATFTAGAAAAVTLPGCGLAKVSAEKAEMLANKEGLWVTSACWHNCGGRCLNKAFVVDGIVTKMKTDDTHPDTPDNPQQRSCARGRSHRQHVLGVDRLKYPMKRKNWEPGGGKKELRGKDEWVRIPWDEALDIVSSEIKRIKTKYGNTAIFVPSGSEIPRTLSLYGGYAARWGAVSWGTWADVYPKITGIPDNGATSGNDRFRLRDSKLVVLWGANPASSSLGTPTYNFLQAKKEGVKFIVIDPLYTETARVLADEWIPIRPATDTTLILAMAYYIITNNLLDKAFLDTYCLGYDANHLPEGVDPKENFKDYVLGTFDGTPKNPEWAAKICGVSAELITEFAKEYATSKPVAVITGGAPARINNGEHFPHSLMTLAFMTGNIGVPGAGVSPNMHARSTYAGPVLVKAGGTGLKAIVNPKAKTKINNCEMWDGVLTGKYTDGPGPKKDVNIQMIYHGFGAALNQRAGAVKGIEAHLKVEFVVSQNLFLNTDARYSDVVLPVYSQWEEEAGGTLTGNREILIYYSQVIKPLYESKSDMWIAKEIGKRLGLDPMAIEPVTVEQQVYNQLAGATVMKMDASGYETLVTFTAVDIQSMGVKGTPQKGRITYTDFKEKGIYQFPRSRGDKFEFTSFEDFLADPIGKKLDTPSGKLEIYCQPLADHIKKFGFNLKSPLPKYEPSIEGYEDGIKDGLPFQLVTIHYLRRSHSTMDNVPWLREAFPQEFWINASDAKTLGVKTNDIVKVTSRWGSIIRPAYVTERINVGVVAVGEGAWIEFDEAEGVDKAGATNVLNGPIPSGQGHTGHNSCNVKLEKYNKPLAPDYTWPQRIIF
ncbi:MAG TPA: molybdopterin-dependent oxidoreductase [Desulfosporosinus sp.]|nr:molybdopterin-dependent oxidoreductase [Desulfosporosinus sp.]